MGDMLVKKRRIKVDQKKFPIGEDFIKTLLEKYDEILSVNYDERKSQLRVEYDLMKINFIDLEKIILQSGIHLSLKWSERLKRGMAKFTEQNELDNLTATPTSCHKDPKGRTQGCSGCHF